MTSVRFYDPSFIPQGKLTYSVIAAKSNGSWIFVRHQNRKTWEIAGGHIEDGETPDDAAGRELMEETGATDFKLECVSTYSVEKEGSTGWGRLFFAEVLHLGPIPDTSEIAEIKLSDHLPENLTYPDIQPLLFGRIEEFLLHSSIRNPKSEIRNSSRYTQK
jgi:8-oxo-dGTP diphosphatase